MTTTNTTPSVMTQFPWQAVNDTLQRMARGSRCLALANRLGGPDELASEALEQSYGRYSRQPGKEWTVAMLASGGLLDVAKRSQRAFGRDVADSETEELLAVVRPPCDASDGLDALLSGLDGRDHAIASAWSEGLQDVAVAERIGCSVKTVERTRKVLAVRMSR